MKLHSNIIALCLIATTVGMSTSCSSDFLDEKLTTVHNTDELNTNTGVEALGVGIYYNLRYLFSRETGYSMFNYGTDEYMQGADGSNSMWNNYVANLSSDIQTVNVNTTKAQDLWDNMYECIGQCNLLLEKLENYTGSLGDQLEGEGKFMRAWAYLNLVTQYGGVPLKLQSSTTVEKEFTRASAEDITAQIITDLTDAYNKLPTSGDVGRITKDAAAHFLAKTYLWRASEINDSWNGSYKNSDLDQVIKYANEVIANHPLADNFADLWNFTEPDGANEKLPEIVLAAQFTDQESTKPQRGNMYHLLYVTEYRNLPGMSRDISGEREWDRLKTTYYSQNVYNHKDDSRLWKSFRTKLNCSKIYTSTASGITYEPGDRGVLFIINEPGDDRFAAVQNGDETFKDYETGKEVPTVFANYKIGDTEDSRDLESDAYLKMYAPNSKYMDGSRATVAEEKGNRDGILARSAEDYFFAAEAYIRKGDYSQAVNYLNRIRERAQWKAGEDREVHVDGGAAWNSSAAGWNVYATPGYQGKGTYYPGSAYYESLNQPLGSLNSQASNLDVTDITNVSSLPAEDQWIAKKLNVSSPYDVAMCFLLNEKSREMTGELLRWVDLARTKTLVARAYAFNPQVESIGNLDEHHLLRAIPQTFLDEITKDGTPLTAAEKEEIQNPGY